jgi:hypothetical protein
MVHYRCREVTSKNSEKVLFSSFYFYYDTAHRGNDITDSTTIVCRNQEAGGFCSRFLQRWEEAGSRRKQEGPVRDQEAAAEVVIGGRRGRM